MWTGQRGITVAEWLLEPEFAAMFCLAGAPFCLSVDAEHNDKLYDQSVANLPEH